jgi:DNA-binding CsgD family transcriptional regulator
VVRGRRAEHRKQDFENSRLPVTRLSARQIRAVLDLVGVVHGARDVEEFQRELLPALRRLVPADYVSFNEVGADGTTYATFVDPQVSAEQMQAWARGASQNPLIVRYANTRDGRAYRFSDVVSREELRDLELFRELYEVLGIRHQVAFALALPPDLTRGIALSRGGSDFTDVQCEMLNLARPHLLQAYMNVRLRSQSLRLLRALRSGLDELGEEVVVLDREGRVAFGSATALELISSQGGGQGRRLPPTLTPPSRGSWEPRRAELAGEQILIRRVAVQGGDEVLSFERQRGNVRLATLRGLGLSPREAEVLAEFARGRTVAEVAERMGITARTVHKHTQHIHAKLGTRDRLQAVSVALAAAR